MGLLSQSCPPSAALPAPVVQLRSPSSTVPASPRDLASLGLYSSLATCFLSVTQLVPCYTWPHPLIISTCVYLSTEMIVSMRPEVLSYLLMWHIAPGSCLLSPSPFTPSLPSGWAQPPEGCVRGQRHHPLLLLGSLPERRW